VVFGSALIYWGGVYIQARRIRRRIGRSPNVKPRGKKERMLWVGWMLVVFGWIALPFLVGSDASLQWLRVFASWCGLASFSGGIALTVMGYAGTLWCYAAMGNTWRMGVDPAEKAQLVTRGPYQWVRHPIYLFQALMLAGTALLLPAPLSFAILVIHFFCVLVKAADEEAHLRKALGPEYEEYLLRTRKFFPKLRSWRAL
jgi:protein-S-isoprenylcysteine O-methyltransferase Ste14